MAPSADRRAHHRRLGSRGSYFRIWPRRARPREKSVGGSGQSASVGFVLPRQGHCAAIKESSRAPISGNVPFRVRLGGICLAWTGSLDPFLQKAASHLDIMSGCSVPLSPVMNSRGPPSEWFPPKTRIGSQSLPQMNEGPANRIPTSLPWLTRFCGPRHTFSGDHG